MVSIEIIVAFITGIFGPLTVIFIKHLLEKNKKKPDMVHETLRVSELIKATIISILTILSNFT